MSRAKPEETRSAEPSTLYPDEGEIARVLMPRNVKAWPGLAVVLEREGPPRSIRNSVAGTGPPSGTSSIGVRAAAKVTTPPAPGSRAMDDLQAPGLKRMKRHNERVDLYWVADEKLVAKATDRRP
jgi:hypothetical protein